MARRHRAEDTCERRHGIALEKALQSLQWIDYISSYNKTGEATLMVNLRIRLLRRAVGYRIKWYQCAQEDRGQSANLAGGTQARLND